MGTGGHQTCVVVTEAAAGCEYHLVNACACEHL